MKWILYTPYSEIMYREIKFYASFYETMKNFKTQKFRI